MANSKRVYVNYKPRYTDQEAYDLCPPQVRRALGEAVTDWCASSALRYCRKNGWRATVEWIRAGDKTFVAKRNWDRRPTPSHMCQVPPLRANW